MGDELDKETSVGLELTEKGFSAKAKSRFIAAVDRLAGNVVDWANLPIERSVVKTRAIIAAEEESIRAIAQYGIDRLRHDPEFARRAAENYFDGVFRKQENRDGVLRIALEDLSQNSQTEPTGKEELDPEFMDRFERYADDATTDQLRQKWGKVLAAEVRKPGTFSRKVLRTVDEIDPHAGLLFEDLCKSRIQTGIPKCLVGELSFSDRTTLVSADLIVDPGLTGHVQKFSEAADATGRVTVWLLSAGRYAVSIPKDAKYRPSDVVREHKGTPAMPAYFFTDVGAAIASIFEDSERRTVSRYAARLRAELPGTAILEYRVDATGITPINPLSMSEGN